VEASGLSVFTEKTADSTGLTIDEGHELIRFALEKAGLQ
jgi:hypothetical protein